MVQQQTTNDNAPDGVCSSWNTVDGYPPTSIVDFAHEQQVHLDAKVLVLDKRMVESFYGEKTVSQVGGQ